MRMDGDDDHKTHPLLAGSIVCCFARAQQQQHRSRGTVHGPDLEVLEDPVHGARHEYKL